MNKKYNNSCLALEFNTIIEKLKEHALSERAKNTLDELSPDLNEKVCIRKMAETTSARKLLDILGSPPLPIMKGLDEILTLSHAGGMLIPEQLTSVAMFSAACKRMKAYLLRGENANETVAAYGRSIENLESLKEEIENCINGESVCDDASSDLKRIRRKKENIELQIKDKLSHILQSRKQYLSDGYITNKKGHYVVPVQRKYQSQFGGTVIETSGKGNTVFMEPSSVKKLQDELSILSIEEDTEIRRILYVLTAEVMEHSDAIKRNMEAMEILDVLFAKAKLSAEMKAVPVTIGTKRSIDIKNGRHPLLKAETCVPLDFKMGDETKGVIITGPNTGGKTVAVKTVGLLSMMAQCGLHVTCDSESYIAMHDGYWCDIGDSQNISQNLSTFSGHMTNVINILENASKDSLVLLDELGSGTDPSEGMGIAIAVLEELRRRECMFLVTTHYPQVKTYAEETQGICSARMAFDRESLRPLYKLEMGKAGESCALHIAKRLGLAEHLLDRAYSEVYGEVRVQNNQQKEQTYRMKPPKSILVRAKESKTNRENSYKFVMGDNVILLPDEAMGIVYQPEDKNGDVVVQVKGEKKKIKHNRLRLKVLAAELYPPDYDFSVIFDSVENRKARKKMSKRHCEDIIINYE